MKKDAKKAIGSINHNNNGNNHKNNSNNNRISSYNNFK